MLFRPNQSIGPMRRSGALPVASISNIMKKSIPFLVLALPIAAVAADDPLDFSSAKISGPTLSLAAGALQGVPSLLNDFRPRERVNVVSKMPILAPSADLDPKMIKTPDSSIDYALIVKTPDLQPVSR
jgi:hypothetical protein